LAVFALLFLTDFDDLDADFLERTGSAVDALGIL